MTCRAHWDQVRHAFGSRAHPEDWRLLPKDTRLPTSYLTGLGAAVTTFVVLPYGEELLRCARAQYRRNRVSGE